MFELKTSGDSKPSRAASVQAIVASGVVVLPQHAPWVEGWLDEVCGYTPRGRGHDDQVDAMVYALRDLQDSKPADWSAYGRISQRDRAMNDHIGPSANRRFGFNGWRK